MGTVYLTIIILWCSPQHGNYTYMNVERCRKEKIECVRKLHAFTTDDVVDKCLLLK